MTSSRYNLGRLAALLVMGSATLAAQGTQTASASIAIVDPAGAPIVGATVRLTSPSLQGVRTGATDASGRYQTRLLPPGFYTIELVKEGFQTVRISQQIGIDQNYQPRVVLQKTSTAVVEVIATANPGVDKTDVKSAINYDMESIDRLPNGRTMEAVAFLTPGVTSGVGGRVQIRGAMTSGNLYLVDGQNVADNAYNNRGVLLINDAIEETQIITGAISAEYGNVDGGVLNAITKSGGNTFSGMLRWDATNPSWNALAPYESRATRPSKLGEFKTMTLGGPILKDRLWFFAAYYRDSSSGSGSIASNSLVGPGGRGTTYATTNEEIRRTFKLTFAINQDHSLVASYGNSQNAQGNRNYVAGEVAALVPQTNTSEYGNFAWRGAWSPTFLTDIRVGFKKQVLSAGGDPNGPSPLYNYDIGLVYNNGIFNSADGGDNRDNQSLNAKGTLFFDAAGNHQMDFGLDYLKGKARAKNEQTPTGYIFGVFGMDLVARTANGADIWTFESAVGEAVNESTGIFVNDKWTVNNNLAIQLGVRFDKYTAKDEKGKESAGASGVSPRLGAKYDLTGDGTWVFGASYAKYNGKVLDAITNSATNQGNPTEIDYPYIGPGGSQPYSVIYNLQNYDFDSVVYYVNPVVNVRLNKNLKAPSVDEIQLTAAYTFSNKNVGQGFVTLTGVKKEWNDLIDFRIGNDGTVTDPAGQVAYLRVWDNSKIAKREYEGLEFRAATTKGAWNVDGNISWSQLQGNYEGEGTSSPGRGEGLENFTTLNGVNMYDRNITAPYGYLVGHQPVRARVVGSYLKESSFGRTTLGWVFRYDSGSHYSDTRTISTARLNPALSGTGFGTSGTQFRDNKRGAYVFNSQRYFDIAISHDWKLFAVKQTNVNGFVKLTIGNVLNHQQKVTWNTVSSSATGTYPNATTSPWVRGTAYGTSTATGNYGAPRTFAFSAGIQF